METAVAGYAENALKSSLGKLGSFLWGEALLVGTVRQDIQFIRDELMSMNAVLQDMLSSGHLNQQSKVWMLQVLTVACDAELCTDEFREKLGIRPGRGLSAAVLHYICSLSTRYRISKGIQALKSRAKEVSERHSRYSTTYNTTTVLMEIKNPESTWVTSKRDTDLVQYNQLVAEGALAGIHNGDTHEICKKVATEDGFMLVIVGSAGSGKTALARMVYRRRNHNFARIITTAAWVTVSDKPDMKRVLEEILRQVTKSPLQGIKEYDVNRLSDKLRAELANDRYLIVLDSLWSVEHWQTIKDALPGTNQGRVVVTTRKENVAEECCRDIHYRARERYDMQQLPVEQLDKLIIELLSNDRLERAHSDYWGKVRKAILHTCPVPLALKCICGALASVDMEMGWLLMMEIDLLSVYERFTDQEDRTKEILLKYCWSEYLPPWLQQCSQDLRNLPEHYAINRKKLMRRWIAKGFIKPEKGLSVEEVAESYFNELISRCIIEPESVHPRGNIRRCLINGVFKEFIAPVPIPGTNLGDNQSQVKRDNNGNNKPVPDPETVNPDSEQQVPNPDPAVFELYNINPSAGLDFVKEKLFSRKPKWLTFLDLEGCKGLSNRELDKLCKFVQLRFLSLRNTDVNHIPKKIGKLKLLETLDIRQTKIKKVPRGILCLDRLKHLLAGYVYKPERTTSASFIPCSRAVEVPIEINGMQALQTLTRVNATKASKILHAVHELTQLKKLGLVIREENLNSKPLCISIMMLSASLHSLSVWDEREGGSLDFLEYLCIQPQNLESLNLRGHLGRLPQWVANHRRLTKITLSHTHLGSGDLKLLGGIRSLLCLKLNLDSFRERELVLRKDEFNALRVLVVCCDAIRTISFEEGAAPSLEVFKWVLFHNRTRNIHGIVKLPMLKDVSLIGSFDRELQLSLCETLRNHKNRTKSLALHVIKKEKWDNTEDDAENKTTNSNGNIFWR
ncbi:disease resistance protein Pik-2-like [Carex rostrata]